MELLKHPKQFEILNPEIVHTFNNFELLQKFIEYQERSLKLKVKIKKHKEKKVEDIEMKEIKYNPVKIEEIEYSPKLAKNPQEDSFLFEISKDPVLTPEAIEYSSYDEHFDEDLLIKKVLNK